MSLVLIVWLVNTVIPGLKLLAVFSVMLMFIIAIIGGLIIGMEGQWQPIKKAVKYWWVAVLVILLSVLLPNKETTWFMVGAYGTQKLVENPDAQAMVLMYLNNCSPKLRKNYKIPQKNLLNNL